MALYKKNKTMKFRDIPQFPQACYEIDVSWKYIEDTLAHWSEAPGRLDLSPDYQRAHVWTRKQQIAYVEYVLMGGEVGRNIIFNCPDWMGNFESAVELVDGKQRIEAVRAFLRDEVPAFGCFYSKFEDQLGFMEPRFRFRMCKLQTRREILRLYLNINAGGTPHTREELDRVRALLMETT